MNFQLYFSKYVPECVDEHGDGVLSGAGEGRAVDRSWSDQALRERLRLDSVECATPLERPQQPEQVTHLKQKQHEKT